MLKIELSLEASSESGYVQGGSEFVVFSKMTLSLETSSKKIDVERALLRYLWGAFSEDPQDSPRGTIIETNVIFQQFC